MTTYKLLISYDGTDFGGWQIQPNAPSVQETIQKALSTVCREDIHIIGSGRTDSGVHALGQTAHFATSCALDSSHLYSVNALLPNTIYIRDIQQVHDEFHAQISAQRKIYSYHLFLGKNSGPFIRRYVTEICYPLDMDKLHAVKDLFVGEHDFAAFANVCKTRIGKSSVRTIYAIDIEHAGPYVTITFEGNGFLYKMVRNLIGAMLLVSSDKLSIDTLTHIMNSKKRIREIPCAPPQGLFLERVIYGESSSSVDKAVIDDTCLAPFLSLRGARS